MADVVEKVLEQNLLRAAKVVEQQLDDEIEKLQSMDDDDLEVLKQRRLAALKKQARQRGEWIQMGHGDYSELSTEKEFFEACKKSQNFVCHFYRPSAFRCKIVDMHLSTLAKKHVETRFCKINAEKSPFLTQRLNVKVLPTIVLCKDAKTKDFIIGFDDLGGTDEFPTEMLEWRIAQSAVIDYSEDLLNPPGSSNRKSKKIIFGQGNVKTIRGRTADSDSDED